ncbi:MAG: hypothetical protein EXS55_04955 [Candidatus Magasanikbacteria bacterium]|nr:hypothetical protein [Candidatus Magasanikbacteria bacterium]
MPKEKRIIEKVFIGFSILILAILVGGYFFFKYAEGNFWIKEEPTTKEVIESNRQWILNSTTKE